MGGLLAFLVILAVIAYAIYRYVKRPRPKEVIPPLVSHGSAKFADGPALIDMGLLSGRGYPLGVWYGSLAKGTEDRKGADRNAPAPETLHALTYSGDRHRLVASPTRGGKFVSCAAPLLLSDLDSSALVVDIKGEAASTTGKWRATGGAVHALDAWGLSGLSTASFNPLDLLQADSPDLAEDAAMIADSIFIAPRGESGGNAMFFNDEAKALLATLLLYVATSPDEDGKRTLIRVREIVTMQQNGFGKLINGMLDSPDLANGLVARGAARYAAKEAREASGVKSTLQQQTHFLDSPRLAKVLGASSFDFADLKKQICTIYLVLPAERLNTHNRWLRLMISIALTTLTRTPGKPIEPVKFIVDEMPALGALESLKTGVSLMAGFGVQFHLIVQDFSQLRGTYGDSWESFIANCGILQVFGVRDLFTARYISDMLGQSTVAVKAMQFSTGGSPGGLTHSKGSSYSELGRPLLTTGEVLTLSPWAQIIFPPSGRPILAGKHFWYAEAPWNMRGQAEQDIFKPLPRPPAAPVAVSGGQGDVMVGVAANAAATSVAVK